MTESLVAAAVVILIALAFVAGMATQKEKMLREIEENNAKVDGMRRALEDAIREMGDSKLADSLKPWLRDN